MALKIVQAVAGILLLGIAAWGAIWKSERADDAK